MRARKPIVKPKELFATRGGSKDEKNITKTEEEALSIIQFCYRSCFLAATVRVASLLWEEAGSPFDLVLLTKFATVLHRFVFGFGLYRVWRLYDATAGTMRLDAKSVYDITKTMSKLWRQSAIVIIMGAMVLSTSVKDRYTGSGMVFNSFSAAMLNRPGSVILAFALMAILPINAYAKKTFKEVEAQGKPVAKGGSSTVSYATARSMGYVSGRDMLFCVGAMSILGLTDFFTAISKTSKVAVGLGLLDVVESATIGVLLFTLHSNFFKAVVSVTDGSDTKAEDYRGLWQSQKGFYGKIGKVMFSQSVFKVLPYVGEAAKALLKALKS